MRPQCPKKKNCMGECVYAYLTEEEEVKVVLVCCICECVLLGLDKGLKYLPKASARELEATTLLLSMTR